MKKLTSQLDRERAKSKSMARKMMEVNERYPVAGKKKVPHEKMSLETVLYPIIIKSPLSQYGRAFYI